MNQELIFLIPEPPMSPISSQSSLFEQAEQKFDLDKLRNDLEAIGEIDPKDWEYLKGILCDFNKEEIAKKCCVTKGTVNTALTRGIRLQILEILPDKNRIDWKRLPRWLIEAGYGIGEGYRVNWEQVCRTMLPNELDNPLISGDGVTLGIEDIVPLDLSEQKERPKPTRDPLPENSGQALDDQEIPLPYNQFFDRILTECRSLNNQGKGIAIIGEPGAGKTTLLCKIADWIINKGELPVFISLQDVQTNLETYLLEIWLKNAICKREAPKYCQDDLIEQCNAGRVWLLLDGVDEMAQSNEALSILAQGFRGWIGNARIVLTCRVNVWEANKNELRSKFGVYRSRGFRDEEQLIFIENFFQKATQIETGGKLIEKLRHAPLRLKDLVKIPLWLTLLCRTWKRQQGELPRTETELYQRFVKTFYDWKNKPCIPENNRPFLELALGELAKKAIGRDGFRFHLEETFIREELDKYDSTYFSIICELGWLNKLGSAAKNPDEYVYTFLHPTFQEYFAALSLSDNPSIIENSLRDQIQLKKWFYPLAMAISLSDHKTVAKLLTPIVTRYPSLAVKLIREESTEFGDEELPLPPSNECGQQIQEAMQAWVIGLEPLSKLIAPLRADGRVRSIGVASHGVRLEWAWYMGTEQKEAVTDLPLDHLDHNPLHPDWFGGYCRRGNEPAWAWRWTLDQLVSTLWRRIDVAELAVENADLTHEAAWNAALAILRLLRIDDFWQLKQIPISAIEPKLKEIEESNVIHCGIWGSTNPTDLEKDYYFRQLRIKINHLQNLDETVLSYPWPGPDLNAYGRIANCYSMEQLKTRMEKVYKAALDAYQLLTQTWFKPIVPWFDIAVQLPARLIGVIYPKDVYYAERFDPTIMKDYDPVFRWFLQPLPKGQANDVWIKIGTQYPDDEFNQKFEGTGGFIELYPDRNLGIRQKSYRKGHLQEELFSSTPAMAITFRWLKDDLKASGWWVWNSSLADRNMFSRW
jgi:hypothetical protein